MFFIIKNFFKDSESLFLKKAALFAIRIFYLKTEGYYFGEIEYWFNFTHSMNICEMGLTKSE